MDKSYDVRWYVTEGSGGRILSGPYPTDQEADSVRNRDAGEWVSGMGDALAEQLRSEELEQGYAKLAADPDYQRECEQRRALRPQVLLERIATLEAYVQKLEDMIYLESLKPKTVQTFPLSPQWLQISPGTVPYPYTISQTSG